MQPVPFRARHLLKMAAQPHQAAALARLTEADLRGLESPLAATLLDALGDPLVCCGAVEHWQDRAYVWTFLSDKITPRNFRSVHAWGRLFLAELPFRRIEASVDVDFDAGHRWVLSFGFKLEAPRMQCFDPAGRDHSLYALVK